MKLSTDAALSDFMGEVYLTWREFSNKLTILDIQILNYIARSHHNFDTSITTKILQYPNDILLSVSHTLVA